MQQDSSTFSHRTRNIITFCLMTVGLGLLVFGAGKAVSQSDDKRYVEGIRQRIQRVRAAGLAAANSDDTASQTSLLDPVKVSEQRAIENSDKSKENQAKDKPQDNQPTRAAPAAHSAAAAKGKAKPLR